MTDRAIYIVDDDASVRDSLALLLSLEGFRVAAFAKPDDFLAVVRADWTGCVLADLRMPGMSGLELQERLARDYPLLAVVIITAHGDVASARQAFLANAVDFIVKPFTPEQILGAIAAAASRKGETAVKRPDLETWARDRLTGRETEILMHITRGMHNREIAAELGISPRTVEVHKARILEKLGTRNVVELVRLVDESVRRS